MSEWIILNCWDCGKSFASRNLMLRFCPTCLRQRMALVESLKIWTSNNSKPLRVGDA